MIEQILAALLGVFAFAVLFHAPRRSYLVCALCGGFCWAVYLLFTGLGLSAFLASVLSVLSLTIVSQLLSVAMKLPATVFIVTGIFPIVPGAAIYRTAYGLISGDEALFRASGMATISTAVAIAMGIVIGTGIPMAILRPLGRRLGAHLPGFLQRYRAEIQEKNKP